MLNPHSILELNVLLVLSKRDALIAGLIILALGLYMMYYVIRDLVMNKWSGVAIKENMRMIIIVVVLLVWSMWMMTRFHFESK